MKVKHVISRDGKHLRLLSQETSKTKRMLVNAAFYLLLGSACLLTLILVYDFGISGIMIPLLIAEAYAISIFKSLALLPFGSHRRKSASLAAILLLASLTGYSLHEEDRVNGQQGAGMMADSLAELESLLNEYQWQEIFDILDPAAQAEENKGVVSGNESN